MVIDLLDADRLAGEDLAQVDLEAVEADAPACGDGDGLVVEGIVELGQAGRPMHRATKGTHPPKANCALEGFARTKSVTARPRLICHPHVAAWYCKARVTTKQPVTPSRSAGRCG